MEIGHLTVLVWITSSAFFLLALISIIGLTSHLLVNCSRKVKKETHCIEETNFEADILKNSSDILSVTNGS